MQSAKKDVPKKIKAPEPNTPLKQQSPHGPTTDIEHEPPYFVHRSKDGLKLIESFKGKSVCSDEIVITGTEAKNNRVESVFCSEDGSLLAWCDNQFIRCIRFDSKEVIFDQVNTYKSNRVCISPKSTKLVSYSTMSGGDNLHFWDLPTKTHLKSMPFKKSSQWQPIFSMNEEICLQHVNSEIHLYSGGKFDQPPQRISHIKVNDVSLSSASMDQSTYQHLFARRSKLKNHHIAIYTSGTKGQPSMVKIYKYPNMNDCVTNKSFFKADSVRFSWSPSGNSLLLICQADFDQSGKSYYGEQSLNFLNVKGDSYFVQLPKEGNVSHIEWYPSCDRDMFMCVYGQIPAKVSLFNHKCEIIHNFESQGSFNTTSFSPFGNLLAIYGFGNLAGQLCVWDFDAKKLISTQRVPETTGLEWCSDGQHILTYTTFPRLRVGNGFRVWHYTGSLVYEQISNDPDNNVELYDITWQPMPGKYKKPNCDSKPSQLPNLINSSKLSKFQGSVGKYVPPSMRNGGSSAPVIDSAAGIGAGGRRIVGLESLNSNNDKDNTASKKQRARRKNKKPQNIETSGN